MRLLIPTLNLLNIVQSFNINTGHFHLINYTATPDPTTNTNFGYSIGLYPATKTNPAGLIVGSPNAFSNAGQAYHCNYTVYPSEKVHEGRFKCNSIRGITSKKNQLLGASVDVNADTGSVIICAPGYSVTRKAQIGRSKNGEKLKALYNPGKCYFKRPNFDTYEWRDVVPCEDYAKELTSTGGGRSQCTSGISAKLISDSDENGQDQMLISAPGADYWQGTVDFVTFNSNINVTKTWPGPIYALNSKRNIFDLPYSMPEDLYEEYRKSIFEHQSMLQYDDKHKEQAVQTQVNGFLLANTWDNNLAGYTTEVFKHKIRDADRSYSALSKLEPSGVEKSENLIQFFFSKFREFLSVFQRTVSCSNRRTQPLPIQHLRRSQFSKTLLRPNKRRLELGSRYFSSERHTNRRRLWI